MAVVVIFVVVAVTVVLWLLLYALQSVLLGFLCNCSPYVKKLKRIPDSGFLLVDSRFLMVSGFAQLNFSGFQDFLYT